MSSTLAPPIVGQAGPTEYGGGRRTRVAVLLRWRRDPVRVDGDVAAA